MCFASFYRKNSGFTHSFVGFDTYSEDENDTRTFPEKYDLSSIGQVTPVKNQYRYGTCWTFSTYASLESCLLKRAAEEKENLNILGAKISLDESENQISVSSVFETNLYIVTYEGEKMTDIQKYTLEESTEDRKFDFNKNQKAFIWDSNMIPICSTFTIN